MLTVHSSLQRQNWIDWLLNIENVSYFYLSFSGGKDSTVLMDIARQIDNRILAVFVDTWLEYPQIRSL